MKRLSILLLTVALSSGAQAAFVDGNRLLSDCSAGGSQAFCLGYIAAISDALSLTGIAPSTVANYRACVPSEATNGQIADAVRQYLEHNPAFRHLSAPGLVAEALSQAFPCRA
jgi:hypothetical protein